MIRDGAPREWTPLMRLVAGEIADDARDPSLTPVTHEGSWPWSALPLEGEYRRGKWRDGLTERCGMSARSISRVLADLAAAGYEMRVPITDRDGQPVKDKRGRLMYAGKGHALRFQVPSLPPRGEPQRSPDPATDGIRNGVTNGVLSSPDPAADVMDRWPDPATCDGYRSPLPVSTLARSGDPIPSVSPHEDQSPQENGSPHGVRNSVADKRRERASDTDRSSEMEAERSHPEMRVGRARSKGIGPPPPPMPEDSEYRRDEEARRTAMLAALAAYGSPEPGTAGEANGA